MLTPNLTDIAFDSDGGLWIAGLGGITIFENDGGKVEFTAQDGLPSVAVQCVSLAPDGTMWVGTEVGIAKYDGRSWSIRSSRRWLLDDNVRDIAFDPAGTAWIATAGGVSSWR